MQKYSGSGSTSIVHNWQSDTFKHALMNYCICFTWHCALCRSSHNLHVSKDGQHQCGTGVKSHIRYHDLFHEPRQPLEWGKWSVSCFAGWCISNSWCQWNRWPMHNVWRRLGCTNLSGIVLFPASLAKLSLKLYYFVAVLLQLVSTSNSFSFMLMLCTDVFQCHLYSSIAKCNNRCRLALFNIMHVSATQC